MAKAQSACMRHKDEMRLRFPASSFLLQANALLSMARKLLAAGFAITAASLASAQVASSYCDVTSGICFQGYTDTSMDMTVGVVLPLLATPPSDEYIVQMVVPASYGWSGVSMGGQMTNSLLVPFWPNGEDIVLGPRWASDYVLPTAYAGPTITLLPASTVNSTHVNAIFRCQNCTAWDGGSLGSGNLNGTAVLAYVASTTTGVDDPSDVNSSFIEHDYFNFFGMDLSTAHSPSYSQYLSGGAGSTTAPPAPSSTPATPSSTSSAPAATQTEFGQCGGTSWTGPTLCAVGLTCVAVSPPYYSQCQGSK